MFQMVLPATSGDLAAAEADAGAGARPVDADAAAARTRADYGRVSRWALGLFGTAGAAASVLLLSGAVAMATDAPPAVGMVMAAIVLLVAAAVGVPSVWLLVALHRSGRRLAHAAGYWAGLPYRLGRRPTRGDWFAVRFLGFSADLFLRLVTAALAALAAVFAVSLFVRALIAADPAWQLVLFAGWGVLFTAVCAGQFGGVQRLQNGYLVRDPASLSRHP